MKNLQKFSHSLFAMAFIPWSSFWAQNSTHFLDLSVVEIALEKSCDQVDEKKSEIIFAEVASTDASKAKGLGNRKMKLTKDKGMIFVFETEQKVSFWMKDTLIPLQIAYFDAKDKLTETLNMSVEKNPSKPARTYPSKRHSVLALEVAPGRIKNKDVMLCVKNPNSATKDEKGVTPLH